MTKCVNLVCDPYNHFSFKPTMQDLVDYTNPVLNSYRSFTHDAILIHGFIPEKAETGTLKALFTISDGIRLIRYRSITVIQTVM